MAGFVFPSSELTLWLFFCSDILRLVLYNYIEVSGRIPAYTHYNFEEIATDDTSSQAEYDSGNGIQLIQKSSTFISILSTIQKENNILRCIIR